MDPCTETLLILSSSGFLLQCRTQRILGHHISVEEQWSKFEACHVEMETGNAMKFTFGWLSPAIFILRRHLHTSTRHAPWGRGICPPLRSVLRDGGWYLWTLQLTVGASFARATETGKAFDIIRVNAGIGRSATYRS